MEKPRPRKKSVTFQLPSENKHVLALEFLSWLMVRLKLFYLKPQEQSWRLFFNQLYFVLFKAFTTFLKYSRSSRKRPPRELEKVVVTRAGRLHSCKRPKANTIETGHLPELLA